MLKIPNWLSVTPEWIGHDVFSPTDNPSDPNKSRFQASDLKCVQMNNKVKM